MQQSVAFGGLRGEVLDPGTGRGHHAIHYASQGYSATGIDSSPAGIELAKGNAERAGVRAKPVLLGGFPTGCLPPYSLRQTSHIAPVVSL